MMFSLGCHKVDKTFFPVSIASTLISSFLFFGPDRKTFFGLSSCWLLKLPFDTPSVTSLWLSRSKIRKKSLYVPVRMCLHVKFKKLTAP